VTGSPDPAEIALRALAGRDMSRAALERRLQAGGLAGASCEETLDRLVEVGLVDDRRLGDRRAAALAARGLGDAAIDARLEGEGVGPDDRAAAIAALEPEEDRARRLAREAGKRSVRSLAASLAGRGFSDDAIVAALEAVDGSAGGELG
jgi:SOS response regulatory protein OraA/RecX